MSISFNRISFFKIFLILFLFSLFFPVRYVFFTNSAFQTGIYSDFTSFSLYLSDILLFLLFLYILWSNKDNLPQIWNFLHPTSFILLSFILWLILGLFWHFEELNSLHFWYFFKFLELIVAYGTIKIGLIRQDLGLSKLFFKFFLFFASIQSVIAVIQYIKQSSIGLNKIGEQVLGLNIAGIAKIVVDGESYVRGYGTFPHPNVLSAFLVFGTLLAAYFISRETLLKNRLIYAVLLFINILGLTVTFSRGAYLALGVGLLVFFGIWILKRRQYANQHENDANPLQLITVIVIVIICLSFSFLLFKPFLLSRATISDQSTQERGVYAHRGIKMATDNPLFAVGLGQSVIKAQDYSAEQLKPWEKQPPHNYFILAAAEMGILGAVILLWILLYHIKKALTTYNLLLTTILVSFLVLMQFDHYFYTLQQTQLLLWVTLGIVAAETKNPSLPKEGTEGELFCKHP